MGARDTIGLIAGEGRLPVLVGEAVLARGLGLVVLVVEGDAARFARADHRYRIPFGDLTGILEILRRHNARELVMAGGISRPRMIDSGDRLFREGLARAGDRRDHAAFARVVLPVLEAAGVALRSPLDFVADLAVEPGVLTAREPSAQEWEDVHLGMRLARTLADLDVGQTVALKDGVILAVEAAEGTDATIRRGGEMGRGVVVVKAARSHQDPRFDLPTIGPQTVEVLRAAGAVVLAVESGRTLLVDRPAALAAADAAGMAIAGVPVDPR